MSISRDTFDPAKNYKRVRYHQDRDLLDSELNEQQDIINNERRKLADILFKEENKDFCNETAFNHKMHSCIY